MATLPYGVLLFVLAAQGGGLPPPVDAMEQLQNDLGGAIARGHFSLADREKLNEINAVLGENIAEQRSAHHVDQRKMKAALKDIEKIEDREIELMEEAEKVKGIVAEAEKASAADAITAIVLAVLVGFDLLPPVGW